MDARRPRSGTRSYNDFLIKQSDAGESTSMSLIFKLAGNWGRSSYGCVDVPTEELNGPLEWLFMDAGESLLVAALRQYHLSICFAGNRLLSDGGRDLGHSN